MNIRTLNRTIEERRPLTMLSSFPIAIKIHNTINALWFNYYLEQNDDELIISIRSIFTMYDELDLCEKKVNIQIKSKTTAITEPVLDKKEYLSLLEHQFIHFDENTMHELLMKVEIQPLLTAYDEATKMVSTEY